MKVKHFKQCLAISLLAISLEMQLQKEYDELTTLNIVKAETLCTSTQEDK